MYISILAGGTGKRFWPISRKKKPKQFIKVFDDKTMLEHTIDRIIPITEKGKIFIITSIEHRKLTEEIVKRRYNDLNIKIIYEPFPRDTAPAVGLVNEMIYREDKEAVVVSLHSDHYIEDEENFREVIKAAVEKAETTNKIVLLGIKPTYPSTGFGYIESGNREDDVNNKQIYKVLNFKEKPDINMAKEFLRKGNYYWNSGMFIWRAARLLNEIKNHEPDLYNGLKKIDMTKKVEYAGIFAGFKKQPIDKAILEKTNNINVIPSDFGWNDIGTFNSIYDIKQKDEKNNVFEGNVKTYNSEGCFIKSNNDKFISLIGLKDIVFIETDDAILITRRSELQNIKGFYENIENENDDSLNKYL